MTQAVPQETRTEDWAALREAEKFLYREAELADAHNYQEWLSLWAKELTYWVPANSDDIDPQRKVSFIYDNRARLEERLFRLGTGLAHSQRPRSKLLRTVSNIELVGYERTRGGTVQSKFVIGELRRDQENVWIGRARHVLVREGDRLLMKEKHVLLLKNSVAIGNLTFLL